MSAQVRRQDFSVMELLENRRLFNAASISGTIYEDLSGNGITSDDTPTAGITVNLYRDANSNGQFDSGDGSAIATTTSTLFTGLYAFNNLATGRYFVKPSLPADTVRTAPASDVHNINVTDANGVHANNNFAFHKQTPGETPGETPSETDKSAVKNIVYIINGKKYTTLAGNVKQGDKVKVKFTVTANVTLSLVSYKATSANGLPLSAQKVYDRKTCTFEPGCYCMKVKVPKCYFQVDFVVGEVIEKFGEPGSDQTYGDRLISAATGGTRACEDCRDGWKHWKDHKHEHNDHDHHDKHGRKDKCGRDHDDDDDHDDKDDDKDRKGHKDGWLGKFLEALKKLLEKKRHHW